MLAAKIEGALNERLKLELTAALTYLSMAAYCDYANLPGFAHWLRTQYSEELSHAQRLYDFINDRSGRAVAPGLEQPPVEFSGPVDVFEQALAHERRVTQSYGDLYALALQEQDYVTLQLVNWFLNEQVEEEKTTAQILERVRMAEKDPAALLAIDRELGARQPEPQE